MKFVQRITPEQSCQFATTSFVAAVLVVALHSLCADGACAPLRWMHELVTGGICETAVPWFFFAAGFFLVGHANEDGWWRREVYKRVRTLLIPFWIWSSVIFMFHVVIAWCIHRFGYSFRGEDAWNWLSVQGFARMMGFDPYDQMPTMWFLRTLFLLVVLSPIFIRFNKWLLLGLFVAYCWFSMHFVPGRNIWAIGDNLLSLRGCFYFTAGLLSRKNEWSIRMVPFPLLVTSAAVLAFVRVLAVEIGWRTCLLSIVQIPPIMGVLYVFCGYVRIPRAFANLSFPLYVVHMMMVFGVTALYGICGIGGAGNLSIGKGALRFALALTFSFASCIVLRKVFPRFAVVAFGGR